LKPQRVQNRVPGALAKPQLGQYIACLLRYTVIEAVLARQQTLPTGVQQALLLGSHNSRLDYFLVDRLRLGEVPGRIRYTVGSV